MATDPTQRHSAVRPVASLDVASLAVLRLLFVRLTSVIAGVASSVGLAATIARSGASGIKDGADRALAAISAAATIMFGSSFFGATGFLTGATPMRGVAGT